MALALGQSFFDGTDEEESAECVASDDRALVLIASWTKEVGAPPAGEDDLAPVSAVVERLVGCWAKAAARHERYAPLGDGLIYADVAGIDGPWAEGESADKAREELEAVLCSWALLRVHEHANDIPEVDGWDLNGL
ncbi:MAG: hypothetical protein SGJ13_04800 [Actinomycetota bacterium]|nr:hypothetical protein [Actinomycetota bacterium]